MITRKSSLVGQLLPISKHPMKMKFKKKKKSVIDLKNVYYKHMGSTPRIPVKKVKIKDNRKSNDTIIVPEIDTFQNPFQKSGPILEPM